MLASYGFSGKFIQRHVKQYEGQDWSLSTIYAVVRRAGFRIKDYRDGLTSEAKEVTAMATSKDMRFKRKRSA